MTSVSTDRRFGVNAGKAVKVPCRVATTANITLSGEQTIDGVSCVTDDRVLVKNQATTAQNGIYVVDTGTWQRSTDFDDILDVCEGTLIPVNQGTVNGETIYRISTTGTITPGTTGIAFELAFYADLGNTNDITKGDALIGVKYTLSDALGLTLHDLIERQSMSLFAWIPGNLWAGIENYTGTTDLAPYITNAINATAGRIKLTCPAGLYELKTPLGITADRFSLTGPRTERGANAYGANSSYAAVRFRINMTDTSKYLIDRYSTAASLFSNIGPFEIENIHFEVVAGHGLRFGREDINGDGVSDAVTDGGGQRYVFGVRLKNIDFYAGEDLSSDSSGVMTRSGTRLLSFTKCFELVVEDVSMVGGDVQVRTWGCDKPTFRNIRSQQSHIPFDLNGSGSFNVQHVLDNVQIESYGLAPIVSTNVAVAANDIRIENSPGGVAGRGVVDMTAEYGYTASVTAGSGVVVFSADMTNILFPNVSIIRLSDGTNTDDCLVIAVDETDIMVATDCFAFGWTDAAANVTRIHGGGPIHNSIFDANYANVSVSVDTSCPAFVYVANRGAFHISNAAHQKGGNQITTSIVIGNRLPSSGYLNSQMSFSNCSPLVIGEPSHPLVNVSNWAENYGLGAHQDSYRSQGQDLDDAVALSRRVWAFTPKRGTTSVSNMHTVPFVNLTGDGNTSQSVWAWKLGAAAVGYFYNSTLPSTTNGGIRIVIRCKAVNASDTLAVTQIGSSGAALFSCPITNSWQNVEWFGAIPSTWTSARASGPGLQITSTNGVYIQSVLVLDEGVGGYSQNSAVCIKQAGQKTITSFGVDTAIAALDLSTIGNGQGISGKIKIKATELASDPGYCSIYKEYSIHFSTRGGTKQVLGSPTSLLSDAASINGATKTIDAAITTAVVSSDGIIYVNVSAGGGSPGTQAIIEWEIELLSPQWCLIKTQ